MNIVDRLKKIILEEKEKIQKEIDEGKIELSEAPNDKSAHHIMRNFLNKGTHTKSGNVSKKFMKSIEKFDDGTPEGREKYNRMTDLASGRGGGLSSDEKADIVANARNASEVPEEGLAQSVAQQRAAGIAWGATGLSSQTDNSLDVQKARDNMTSKGENSPSVEMFDNLISNVDSKYAKTNLAKLRAIAKTPHEGLPDNITGSGQKDVDQMLDKIRGASQSDPNQKDVMDKITTNRSTKTNKQLANQYKIDAKSAKKVADAVRAWKSDGDLTLVQNLSSRQRAYLKSIINSTMNQSSSEPQTQAPKPQTQAPEPQTQEPVSKSNNIISTLDNIDPGILQHLRSLGKTDKEIEDFFGIGDQTLNQEPAPQEPQPKKEPKSSVSTEKPKKVTQKTEPVDEPVDEPIDEPEPEAPKQKPVKKGYKYVTGTKMADRFTAPVKSGDKTIVKDKTDNKYYVVKLSKGTIPGSNSVEVIGNYTPPKAKPSSKQYVQKYRSSRAKLDQLLDDGKLSQEEYNKKLGDLKSGLENMLKDKGK